MKEFIETILIAFIPAIISFAATMAVNRTQIKSLEEQNKHEIDKLMKQHEINIENLKEKHALEMESKDKEYQYQLEIQKRNHENEMMRLQKEGEDRFAMEGMKGLFAMIGNIAATPEGQKLLGQSVNETNKDDKM